MNYYWTDNETQLEEDEQLARAIQESLNVESPPPQYGYEIGNSHGYQGNGHGYQGNGNAYQGNGNAYQGNVYQPIPVQFPMGYRYLSRFAHYVFFFFSLLSIH